VTPIRCCARSCGRRPSCTPYEPLLGRAVEISSKTRSGLYDCLYVALAEREVCKLVTDDQKLLANLKPLFPFIVPLASLPDPAGKKGRGSIDMSMSIELRPLFRLSVALPDCNPFDW